MDKDWRLKKYGIKCFKLNIKTWIKTYSDKVYTNCCGLNMPEDYIESESFTVISIDSCLWKQILPESIFRFVLTKL